MYRETIGGVKSQQYVMEENIESLKMNNTWKLMDLWINQKVVECNWIFK